MIFNVLHFAAFENDGQDVGKTWGRRTTQERTKGFCKETET